MIFRLRPTVGVTLSSQLPLWKAFFPYLLVILFLIAGKLWSEKLSIEIVLAENISHRLSLFSPGFILLVAGILTWLFFRGDRFILTRSVSSAWGSIAKPFFTVLFVGSLVQILLRSHQNTIGVPGMLEVIALPFQTKALPLVSPFLGALGSFLAGSATVSNLLFGGLQAKLASSLGFDTSIILGLQLVGAGAGNMIALPNCVAVQASVKHTGESWRLLAELLPYCLLYVVVAGVVGLVLSM